MDVSVEERTARISAANEGLAQEVALVVEDDGVGFNPSENANKAKGLGLVGMGECEAILQGELNIQSEEGKGTRNYARVPAIYQDGELMPM